MFSVKLKIKEGPRTNSLPRRRRATPSSSFSSSTSSLSRLQNNGTKTPTKSSFLSHKNGKNNKKVRIQTSYEPSSSSFYGRWSSGTRRRIVQATYCFHSSSIHAERWNSVRELDLAYIRNKT